MRKMAALIMLVILNFLMVGAVAAWSQNAPPPEAPASYQMTMGDLMNTFVQPRHVKLGLAGRAGNWRLAQYALVEIRQTFADIIKAQPRFRGYPVAELVDAALKQPLAAVGSRGLGLSQSGFRRAALSQM
jgi:hypothetical protein